MKKFLVIFLCGILLLCISACKETNINDNTQSTESIDQNDTNSTENINDNTQPTESIDQNDTNSTENINDNTQPTESIDQNDTNSTENINDNTQSTESIDQNDTNNQATAIFVTKNIKRITFYAYYGNGKGSDVPAEHLNEIITWLDSFTIDEEAPELVPPGTNTINVEIEYMDGTVVKKGLDTTTVDGITYYIKGDTAPECYNEIISKVSLN